MNALAKFNEVRRREVEDSRGNVERLRSSQIFPTTSAYPLSALEKLIVRVLQERSGSTDISLDVDFIDRRRFGGDLALKLPDLLEENGARAYIEKHIPWIVEALRGADLVNVIRRVDHKGIYVNVTLTEEWFLHSVQSIVDLAEEFGRNDTRVDRTQIIDYSSPNVAKVLHAGHFRSTMIGHVLANLNEACGALVYRVNHINDFGGFGFMLEGYRRFNEYFPETMSPNGRLLEIYAIRRALERAVAEGRGPGTAGDADAALLGRYFPGVTTNAALREVYEEFVAASDTRFARLEEGDQDEVELWKMMVEWSLEDFRSFYAALGIHIEFTIGESFYLDAGNAVVDQAIRTGKAVKFGKQLLDEKIAGLDHAVETGEITQAVHDKSVALLEKDLGAIVVLLPGGEQLVVRRSDGRSIYATRDLGAIKLRREIFDPTDIYYVVGQEQRVHFSRLFQAAEVLGLAGPSELYLKHIYFGFYVDADSGKKLSSRDSVAGVTELLAASVEHFRKRSAEHAEMSEEELDIASRQLAVGSVVFNDLKRDMKASVGISKGDLSPTISEFEKSGGSYVVYTACRARAILRRYGRPLPHAADITSFEVNEQEAVLIPKILEFPSKVAKAASEENPSLLVRYLLDLAAVYNTYYASSPVLEGSKANEFRLLITRAAQLALTNGLSLCHVECPEKI